MLTELAWQLVSFRLFRPWVYVALGALLVGALVGPRAWAGWRTPTAPRAASELLSQMPARPGQLWGTCLGGGRP